MLKKATKILNGFSEKKYETTLKYLAFTALETIKLRGDLIEQHLRPYIFPIFKIYLLKLHKKVLDWTAQNILSVGLTD